MILGIDPGLKGGWAALDPLDQAAGPMPLAGDLYDCAAFIDIAEHVGTPRLVVIERVGAMPKQGLSSTFKFGRGFGQLIGMCQALRWPFILVTPQAWKAKVLAGTGHDKEAAIAFCRSRYPGVPLVQPGCRVAHDGVADAVCLAHYGLTAAQ